MAAGFDGFLEINGIKGESADAKHKGQIDIESFSWGMEQTGVSANGGGGGAGKVKVHDMHFTKKTDASSPLLMLNCASGAHIKEARFTVRKAGGTQLEYIKIKLTDVLVSSYVAIPVPGQGFQIGAAGLWGDGHNPIYGKRQHVNPSAILGPLDDHIPTEQFSLNFAKIQMEYQPQGADGKAQGGPIIAGWDVKSNVKYE